MALRKTQLSAILQDCGVDAATIAGMLGHISTKFVHKTYQRYCSGKAFEAINQLPDFASAANAIGLKD